jgi:broad specificity phosphatase PhoE
MLFSSTEPGLEVVVSSGNLIGYLIVRAFGAPASHWIRTRVNLCSISKVFVTSNRSRVPLVESIGDTSHLPKELQLYH